jgi:hypothetical protein
LKSKKIQLLIKKEKKQKMRVNSGRNWKYSSKILKSYPSLSRDKKSHLVDNNNLY